ncbi:L-serine ammonia-lyase, iron-sulfur-dependent subunit beta [Natranaerobius trueperi]|uniref:L-serine deaminase n=1 Tax=Natranaerobius trueperi TaxID=759412 RepID=A0A226C039_9FIRM|nr:L-serine ammonia-lyase, iron-sulfur-dependent subunit beta [Natranaerobius trueperi]OWZ84596.1 L-serine ammonia-lyase, iron-sulfur-dependent, subunit beta [Natranaerobius trueperi]
MNTGVFEVLGPIMIGPSSSHTAGACRLGLMARQILQGEPVKATIYLHESFQKTRKGHGTEVAILGGILGITPDDERLRKSKEISISKGVEYQFLEKELKGQHPNSCQISLTSKNGKHLSVTGSSIGGGQISISQIDDFSVNLSGQYNAILTKHKDRPGIINRVTKMISSKGINIAYMQISRTKKGDSASLIAETDEPITDNIQKELESHDDIYQVKVIRPL